MKTYIYVITDCKRATLHVGMSNDLSKTLNFYKDMPTLFFDQQSQLTRLVYFEEYTKESLALSRFKMLSHFTRMQKERLIISCNPDWLDLTDAWQFERKQIVRNLHLQERLPFAV